MADLLIAHLETKSKEHSALQLLRDQWGFDKELIPKALQNIGNLFPHYSRHDISHSKQILINIERLLGVDNISRLTATDTWLLLEAAYWHDIGMVVPNRDIEQILSTVEFEDYIDSIKNSPNHELSDFAKEFSASDLSKCFCGAETPLDAVNKFREIMAEWFRREHAKRARKIVEEPWERIGLHSPRTELIPKRLYRVLGKICYMHGLPFYSMFEKEGIPFKEAGMAQEDCHPRFVACLLRLGDLLDVDDNRFCPVMQSIAGETRSFTSRAHEDKHLGIRHLRVDRDAISLKAECETIEGYLECFKWFDWLKQEVELQITNWNRIVPSREFGLLPVIKEASVSINGSLQILNEGQRPQITVDSEKALKLFQGANLYKNSFACIRELIQNAIDATLIKIWLTKKNQFSSEQWGDPLNEEIGSEFRKYNIDISLIEKENSKDEIGKSIWEMRIKDDGIGISLDDLKYMLNVGFSSENVKKQRVIKSMPEWMKPSGNFGIGFQSVFMIADKVCLETRSAFTNELLNIEIHSPNSKNQGLAIIKSLGHDNFGISGTTIVISFEFDKIARSYTINHGESKNVEKYLSKFDPVLSDSLPLQAAEIADEIEKVSKLSPIHICGKIVPEGLEVSHIKFSEDKNPSTDVGIKQICRHETDVFQVKFRPNGTNYSNFSGYYRGQEFETNRHFPYIDVTVNILSGKANEWLMASRDKISKEGSDRLFSAIDDLIYNHFKEVKIENITDEKDKYNYSLFLAYRAMRDTEKWESLYTKFGSIWTQMPLNTEGDTYNSLAEKGTWTFGVENNRDVNISGVMRPLSCELMLDHNSGARLMDIICYQWSGIDKRFIQYDISQFKDTEGNENSEEIKNNRLIKRMSRTRLNSFTNDALAYALYKAIDVVWRNQRYFIPGIENFSTLYLNDLPSTYTGLLFDYHMPVKHILLPFLFEKNEDKSSGATCFVTANRMKEVCEWTKRNLFTDATLEEIAFSYNELIKYIDEEIMAKSVYSDVWKKARNVS